MEPNLPDAQPLTMQEKADMLFKDLFYAQVLSKKTNPEIIAYFTKFKVTMSNGQVEEGRAEIRKREQQFPGKMNEIRRMLCSRFPEVRKALGL